MFILAFDSSVNACSVAVLQEEKVLYEQTKLMITGQAEALLPMIDEALHNAEVSPKDLGLIAVTSGPGSFTGIRISLSAAKAFGLALNIPVMGIPTTEAFAISFDNPKARDFFGVVIETKRNDFYFQIFDKKFDPVSDMFYKTANDINKYIVEQNIKEIPMIGDGINRFIGEITEKPLFKIEKHEITCPSIIQIAKIAKEKFLENKINNEKKLVKPFYLRPPDVSCSKNN